MSQIDTKSTLIVKLNPSREQTLAQYLEAIDVDGDDEGTSRQAGVPSPLDSGLPTPKQSGRARESGLDIKGTLARSAESKTSLESVGSDCYVESFPDDSETKKRKEIKAKKRRTIVRFLSFLDMRDTSERKSTMRSSISSVDWRSSIHMRDSIMQGGGYSERRKSDSIIETVDESLYSSPMKRSIRKSVRSSLKLFAFFGRKKNQVSPTPSMRG